MLLLLAFWDKPDVQWWKNFLSDFIAMIPTSLICRISWGNRAFQADTFHSKYIFHFLFFFTKLKDHLAYLLAWYIFHLANALHHQDLCHKIYCARDTFDTLGFFCEKGTGTYIVYQNKYRLKFSCLFWATQEASPLVEAWSYFSITVKVSQKL